MKKVFIGMMVVLSLGIVGCSTTKPTEEELKEYEKVELYYSELIGSQLKWQDEIESSISSNVDSSGYNIDASRYEKLMNDIKERQIMADDINLEEIEKYYTLREYGNSDKEDIEEIRQKDIKEVQVKTERLKNNIKLYEEMLKLAEDGVINEDEMQTKASLSNEILINTDIISSIGLRDNID